MTKFIFILFTAMLFVTKAASASEFYSCKSKYALCTTAACQPVPGKRNLVSCDCKVRTGYSAASQQCKAPKKTKNGELIYSRYYPVKSYVSCSNNRPWAWCLDKPCIVDKNDPSKAACACSIAKNMGNYVIVTKKGTSKTCTTGIISSATIKQIDEITDFLKTQKELKPYPIKVLTGK